MQGLRSKLTPESAGWLFDLKELINYFERFLQEQPAANLDAHSTADIALRKMFEPKRNISSHNKMLEATAANDTFYTNYKLLWTDLTWQLASQPQVATFI